MQIGVNPLYFQFYTPNCQDPVHVGFKRPTFAGVLTGYDLSTVNEEFWELFIRRHGEDNNKVKLACVFEKDGEQKPPFAGIASKMYQVNVLDTEPVGYVDVSSEGSVLSSSQLLNDEIDRNGGGSNLCTLTIPTSRLDCSLHYDLTDDYPNLKTLILQGDDAITCLTSFSFSDDVSIAFASGQSSNRRLQSAEIENKEVIYDGLNIGSLLIGNNMFNNYNYHITIKSMNLPNCNYH